MPDLTPERQVSAPTFKAGDRVRWTSQAAGRAATKEGVIVAVVPPRREPNNALTDAGVRGRIAEAGWPRDHESYVVRARVEGRGSRLYWPVVARLELVQP